MATVADVPLGKVPLGCEALEVLADVVLVPDIVPVVLVLLEAGPVVDEMLPVIELVPLAPVVDDVEPVFEVLLHGPATVGVVCPCVPPVTLPALPATRGVPGVTDGEPVDG